jgi:hypothetical protein
LIQRTTRPWSACKRKHTRCLIEVHRKSANAPSSSEKHVAGASICDESCDLLTVHCYLFVICLRYRESSRSCVEIVATDGWVSPVAQRERGILRLMHAPAAPNSPKLKEQDHQHGGVIAYLASRTSMRSVLPVRQSVQVLERRSEYGDSSTPGNSRYQRR